MTQNDHFITTVENNKYYYLKETRNDWNPVLKKTMRGGIKLTVWVNKCTSALSFEHKGKAEYFAAVNGIKKFFIKKEEI